MKYHVRLSKQMRTLQIALMICVLIAGLAGAVYGIMAANIGLWSSWKPAGYVFAAVMLAGALIIAGNGYREITTRVVVYPGKKVIVHKGQSVKTYEFAELKKPKPAKIIRRGEDGQDETGDKEDPYGLSMILREKNGRKIVKLSTSYKYVRRLEEDLYRYL